MKTTFATALKQTELGKVPGDWNVMTIDDVAHVVGGGTPSTDDPENFGGDITWITPKDLARYQFRYIKHGERNITKKGLENSSAKLLPTGTVLLTTRAPVGYVAIADNQLTTNQGFRNLVPKSNVISEFLYYLLKLNTDYLKSHASGTTFGELSGNTLKSMRFVFPPLTEQKSIARILSSLDSKIELNQQMNKTLEAIAQAIFRHWFVDFEFPNEEGKPYKSSGGQMVYSKELNKEMPKGWRTSVIGREIAVGGGTTPDTSERSYWVGGSINWATPKDLSQLSSPILTDTERKITTQGLDSIGSRKYPSGTLLMSSRAPIGYLAISDTDVSVNQGIIAMVCNQSISNFFMLNWCVFNMIQIRNRANGTTFGEISKSNFRSMPLLVPPESVLATFDRLVQPMYSQVNSNVKQSRTLAGIRDTLLPKLMSGKIRVPIEVR